MSMTRYPVIALDYSEKDKAVPKELLVDYTNGNIYIVSATDKSVIFNITQKILEQISDLSAENLTVEIQGLGAVNLTEFLNQMYIDVNNTVQIKDPGNGFSYIIKDNAIDMRSLRIFNGNIQVDNYASADVLAIAQKTATGIRWMPMSELIGSLPNSGVGSGYDAVDGDLKIVPVLTASNNKIYLVAHAEKSYNLTGNFANVYLPATVDEYSIIKWQITQFVTDFQLIFESNVFIARSIISDIKITNNYPGTTFTIPKCTDTAVSNYKFQFETFDSGVSWLLTVEEYNNQIPVPQ